MSKKHHISTDYSGINISSKEVSTRLFKSDSTVERELALQYLESTYNEQTGFKSFLAPEGDFNRVRPSFLSALPQLIHRALRTTSSQLQGSDQ